MFCIIFFFSFIYIYMRENLKQIRWNRKQKDLIKCKCKEMTNGIVARPVRREETWTAVRVAPRKAFRGHAFEIWLAFWHWVIRDRNPGQEHRLNFRFKLRFVMRVVPFSLLPFLPLILIPLFFTFVHCCGGNALIDPVSLLRFASGNDF